MKKLNLYILIVFILFCQDAFSQKADAVKWMIGTWKINTPNGSIIEKWEIKNDSTLAGKSSFVRNNTDTIPQESIEMAFRNGDWYYIPTANNQNNNQPVSFKVIFTKGTEFISENPAHDFPQRIAYRRIKNQLFASIEGKNKGKYAKQNFDFSIE